MQSVLSYQPQPPAPAPPSCMMMERRPWGGQHSYPTHQTIGDLTESLYLSQASPVNNYNGCDTQHLQLQSHPQPPPPPYSGSCSVASVCGANGLLPQSGGLLMDTSATMMDIKVEPDTMMEEYSPGSYIGSASPGSQSSPLGSNGSGGRSRKIKEDKTCGVCGDKALGYNFDAISCESCKAFFRRNAPKSLDYFKCPYDEKCKMDISNRRFCKRCRLKKCFEIGMRKEYILTDDEKARKRAKIEENRCASTSTRIMREVDRQPQPPPLQQPILLMTPGSEVTSQSSCLAYEDAADIEELETAYKASLEIEMEVDMPRDQANNFGDLVNIAELSVRRVIAMAKQIKSFKVLPQPDQIALLKGGSIELLILRSVVAFDKEKMQFLDGGDQENTKALKLDQFQRAETGTGLFEEHMKFVKTLVVDLGADFTTLLILLIISLFSPDRDNLVEKEHVSRQQERYSMLLGNYLESVYPYHRAHSIYPKLLMKLTDIRNLNEEHSQVLLKVRPEGIQPLMKEVLDLSV